MLEQWIVYHTGTVFYDERLNMVPHTDTIWYDVIMDFISCQYVMMLLMMNWEGEEMLCISCIDAFCICFECIYTLFSFIHTLIVVSNEKWYECVVSPEDRVWYNMTKKFMIITGCGNVCLDTVGTEKNAMDVRLRGQRYTKNRPMDKEIRNISQKIKIYKISNDR